MEFEIIKKRVLISMFYGGRKNMDNRREEKAKPQIFGVNKKDDRNHRNGVTRRSFVALGSILAAGGLSGGISSCADPSSPNKNQMETKPIIECIKSLKRAHVSYISDLTFSPDGQLLASCSRDTTIKLWRLPDGGLLNVLTGNIAGVSSIVFSADGKSLISGASDGKIKIWDVPSARLTKR